MYKFRRGFVAVTAVGALVLAACGSSENPNGVETNPEEAAETEESEEGSNSEGQQDLPEGDSEEEEGGASSEEVELVFSHVLADSHPWQECGTAAFEEALDAADVGLSVDVFAGGQLHGDVLEALDAMDSGNLDLTYATPAQLGTRDEALSVFDAVYLFRDQAHQQAALDSPAAQELWDQLAESGLVTLSAGYFGTRHVTSDEPISGPEDMSGVKIRVIDAPLWLDNAVALGGDPTPVAVSELYIALQQGVVDAQENPAAQISALSLYEVQEWLSLTGHVVGTAMPVISRSSWDSLSNAQQEAMSGASRALTDAATDCTLEQEAELLAEWSGDASPISVNEDIDLEAFQQNALETLFPTWDDAWGEVYREIQSIS